MPMMPFIGVRISWLMLARNSDLARVEASAWSRASASSTACAGAARRPARAPRRARRRSARAARAPRRARWRCRRDGPPPRSARAPPGVGARGSGSTWRTCRAPVRRRRGWARDQQARRPWRSARSRKRRPARVARDVLDDDALAVERGAAARADVGPDGEAVDGAVVLVGEARARRRGGAVRPSSSASRTEPSMPGDCSSTTPSSSRRVSSSARSEAMRSSTRLCPFCSISARLRARF